ncbi:hypothetical protein DRN85_05715 [Methanosarcinales archaeon]|nr:MAG: hypothetical protein DRN85_05715 [Methanosarcinales archaeon]
MEECEENYMIAVTWRRCSGNFDILCDRFEERLVEDYDVRLEPEDIDRIQNLLEEIWFKRATDRQKSVRYRWEWDNDRR